MNGHDGASLLLEELGLRQVHFGMCRFQLFEIDGMPVNRIDTISFVSIDCRTDPHHINSCMQNETLWQMTACQ